MRRYGVTQLELLSGRRTDEFIWRHSTEEITAEQERSADFLQEFIIEIMFFFITLLLHKN